MELLVTGGAGFIGSNFIRYYQEMHPDCHIINFDKLTYAGNLKNLADMQTNRYSFIQGDITNHERVDYILSVHKIDIIVHFAAESHVDRSIGNAGEFIRTNINGTHVLLEAARKHGIRFIQISTDEVYGTLGDTGFFTEDTPLSPNSPYSASKASADLLVRSYHETYGLPVNITRCSNNYGPYQYPEKLIPLMIIRALTEREMPVYGDGKNIRDWLHVKDHCAAIDLVIQKGRPGEIYNIGGNNERSNLEIVETILESLGASKKLISFIPDRLGHDYRYAIDSSKIQGKLGWKPEYTFKDGLTETIQWYQDHQNWWKKLL